MHNIYKTKALFFLIFIIFFFLESFGVDGYSVTTHWTGSNEVTYGGWGEIIRHDILNDSVVRHVPLYRGQAMFPVFNIDGTKVAFILKNGTGGKVATINTNGTGMIVYEAARWDNNSSFSQGGYIDWPEGDWIYYSRGGFYDRGSSEIWRLNTSTSDTELVLTFVADDLSRIRQWAWSMSADGTRMCLRPNNYDLVIRGVFFFKMPSEIPSTYTFDINGGPNHTPWMRGCQNAISASGTHICYGTDHDHILVKEWWNYDTTTFAANIPMDTLHTWEPGKTVAGTDFNRNRWSNNDNEWICTMEGWGSLAKESSNQVLYNWVDSMQIVVTDNEKNSKTYDCAGDFHVGHVVMDPAMYLVPGSVSFEVSRAGPAPPPQSVAITNIGSGTLDPALLSVEYTTADTGWLSASISGDGNRQIISNTIVNTDLAFGKHTATVFVSVANAQSVAYTVTITSYNTKILTDVTIEPDTDSVTVNDSIPFTATAFDQYGNVFDPQPAFTWQVSDTQLVISDGWFKAGDIAGSYIVTAEATIGTITKVDSARVWVLPHSRILQVTNPKKGDLYRIGDTLPIQWTCTNDDLFPGGVVIEISLDAGRKWRLLCEKSIDTGSEAWGNYKWEITDSIYDAGKGHAISLVSRECKIRVRDYNVLSTAGLSDSLFAIVGDPSVIREPTMRVTAINEVRIQQASNRGIILQIWTEKQYSIRLVTMLGATVMQQIGTGNCSIEIPGEQLSSGVYFLKGTLAHQPFFHKFVVY